MCKPHVLIDKIDIHPILRDQDRRDVLSVKNIQQALQTLPLHRDFENGLQIAIKTALPVKCYIGIKTVLQEIHFPHLRNVPSGRDDTQDPFVMKTLECTERALRNTACPV